MLTNDQTRFYSHVRLNSVKTPKYTQHFGALYLVSSHYIFSAVTFLQIVLIYHVVNRIYFARPFSDGPEVKFVMKMVSSREAIKRIKCIFHS